MITCPICHRRPTKRDGRDHRDRQRYACRACHRHFTASSSSIFAGYRWPGEVILAAIRWYLS
jgi:transposase-like protein